MGDKREAALEAKPVGYKEPERNNHHPQVQKQSSGRSDLLEDVKTRDRLVEDHLALVYRLCRRFVNCGEPREDLAQVGTIGLMKAIEKYDSTRGISFTTYAVPVIVGEIKNYLRDHGWAVKVPRKLQRQKLAVHRAVDALGQSLGRAPTIQEIAETTEFSEEEVFDTFEVVNYARPMSLDAEFTNNGGNEGTSLIDRVGGEDPQFERLSDVMDLINTLGCLDKREKTVLYLKYYADLPQTEIGRRLGISQMHVSRVQRSALSKLRRDLVR